jgi:hypothetical protein
MAAAGALALKSAFEILLLQMRILLPGCFSAAILQNLSIKDRLYPTSGYGVLRMRSHAVISLLGAGR